MHYPLFLFAKVLFMIICLHRNGKRRLFKTQKVPGHYSLTRAFLPKNEFFNVINDPEWNKIGEYKLLEKEFLND